MQAALAIFQEIKVSSLQADVLCNLGETQIRLAQYDEAQENLQKALAIFRETKAPAAEAEVLKLLAELHHNTGKLEEARDYCDATLQLAIKLGIPLVEDCQKLKEELKAGGE